MKIVIALLSVLVSASAFAGSVNATCEQAQSTYNANGRIYVQTNNTTVPVYGLTQSCPTGYEAEAYWIRTTDTNTCVIGYSCYIHTGNH